MRPQEMRLIPNSDAEAAIDAAITILICSRETHPISSQQFLAVCKAAPQYAVNVIFRNRPILLQRSGAASEMIGHMIRTVEWELLGATQFLDQHLIGVSEDKEFILQQLTANPRQFSRDDLNAILSQHRRANDPVRVAALSALTSQVLSFADRLVAEPLNLSHDIDSLKASIKNYGFSAELNATLQRIDEDLQRPSDGFDQVATMKHIRSFFEKLHESVARTLQLRMPALTDRTKLNQCGNAIDYLERTLVITEKLRIFARAIYGILSDGDYGVHALKASRDYTRLCRNIVVEYAVTLFFELERRLSEPVV